MQKVCRSASSLHEAKKTKQQTNDMNERCFFIANLKFNCKVNKIFHEHKEIEKKEGVPRISARNPLSQEGGDLLSRIAVQYHRCARA